MEKDIDHIITAGITGERPLTSEERKQLDLWLENEQNRKEYEELRGLWEETGRLAPLASLNINADWQKVRANSSRRRSNTYQTFWKAAASVALLALAGGLYHYFSGGWRQEVIAASEGQEVVLPDGSQAVLRKGTALSWPYYAGSKRKVFLQEGTVYFDVKRDENRPFVISTGQAAIEVLGTSFQVENRAGETSVAVTSGKVGFYAPLDSLYLEKEQSGRLRETAGENTLELNSTSPNELSWYTGRLTFHETSLLQVAADLSRHFDKPVVIGDEVTNDKWLTADFEGQELEDVLEEIGLVLGLDYKIENENVVIHE